MDKKHQKDEKYEDEVESATEDFNNLFRESNIQDSEVKDDEVVQQQDDSDNFEIGLIHKDHNLIITNSNDRTQVYLVAQIEFLDNNQIKKLATALNKFADRDKITSEFLFTI